MHPSSPGANNTFLRSNPSRIPKESIFVKDVVTHLPYYIVNRAITQRFFAYMIDEERIIGLRVSFIFKDDGDELFFDLFSRLIIRKGVKIWSYTCLRCSRVTLRTLQSSQNLFINLDCTVVTRHK